MNFLNRYIVAIMKTVAVVLLLAAVASATWVKPKKAGRLDMGEVAAPGQFPYAVGLKNFDSPSCGAAIVGPRHVLTEAWCFDDVADMSIIAGCEDYYSPNCTVYKFQNVWIHPNASGLAENDLAIISVTEDFALSDMVGIVMLSEDVIPAGANATVTGWSPELKFLDVTIVDCDAGWADPTTICSSPSVVSIGDYGSPLVVDGVLAGIPVIGGTNDVHQRVSSFVPWIQSVVAGKL